MVHEVKELSFLRQSTNGPRDHVYYANGNIRSVSVVLNKSLKFDVSNDALKNTKISCVLKGLFKRLPK